MEILDVVQVMAETMREQGSCDDAKVKWLVRAALIYIDVCIAKKEAEIAKLRQYQAVYEKLVEGFTSKMLVL